MPTHPCQVTAEGLPKCEIKKRREAAIDSGYLVLSLLHVCRAACDYAEDQEGTPLAAHMHSSVKLVLEQTQSLATEMLSVLEISAMHGETAQ